MRPTGIGRSRVATALAAVAATLAVALVAGGCGSSSSAGSKSGSSSVQFAGSKAARPKPAPKLSLKDSLGDPINIQQFKGKAVLVTFIYTHCPDVCPLIVGHLHTAQAQLGPDAKKLQIIAVSTDPRGDNSKTVAAFLKVHQMTGRMQYLIGSQKQLEHVWADWNIIAKPSPTGRDRVEHSALIYGISASGKLTTLYPANFSPSQIVHDVPLLASE